MTFLSIQGLRFSYGARPSPVLDGVDLAAEPGEVVAVVGPNGAGKSTLFRCLAGLLRPPSGRMTLGGLDLRPMSRRERARRVSYLMQGAPPDVALPVFEVVLFARRGVEGGRITPADIRRVEKVLDQLGLAALADRPARALSGGQQQMAALAQALARDPDLLLLDEPTSALDLRRQLEVMETVRSATRERGLVTLVAIHDLALAARFADRLALLNGGRVVADGGPEDVLRSRTLADTYEVRLDVERTARETTLVDPSLAATGRERSAWAS